MLKFLGTSFEKEELGKQVALLQKEHTKANVEARSSWTLSGFTSKSLSREFGPEIKKIYFISFYSEFEEKETLNWET